MATSDKESMANVPGSKTDKTQTAGLYFPESMLQEIKEEAARLDRSLSWVVQRAWKISSRTEIKKLPSVERCRRRRRRGGRPDRPKDDALLASTRGGDRESFALGPDGTRHYVRTRTAGYGPSDVHAILSDGILCDGFIWKYLWAALSGRSPAGALALSRPRT